MTNMRGPALKTLKRVALIRRDQVQRYPGAALSDLLAPEGVELVEGEGHADVDLVIAMGGDGTVLQALSAYPAQPTLAINFGRVGFLTQGDREDLVPLVQRLLRGDYFIEHRLAIEVSVRAPDGTISTPRRCINEVVLKGIAHINEITLSIDGDAVHTCRGDGIIIGIEALASIKLNCAGSSIEKLVISSMSHRF